MILEELTLIPVNVLVASICTVMFKHFGVFLDTVAPHNITIFQSRSDKSRTLTSVSLSIVWLRNLYLFNFLHAFSYVPLICLDQPSSDCTCRCKPTFLNRMFTFLL